MACHDRFMAVANDSLINSWVSLDSYGRYDSARLQSYNNSSNLRSLQLPDYLNLKFKI